MTLRSLKIPEKYLKCDHCGRRAEHVLLDKIGKSSVRYLKKWACPCGRTTVEYAEFRSTPKPVVTVGFQPVLDNYWSYIVKWRNGLPGHHFSALLSNVLP